MEWRRRPFAGSFQAVASGFLAGLLVSGPLAVYAWLFLLAACLPVWLFVFCPLYALVPRDSPLWRPAICIPCGIAAGGAILVGAMVILNARSGAPPLNGRDPITLWMLADAMVVGGVTCLVACRNAARFLDDPQPVGYR